MDWGDLRYFLAVARAGRLAAAGRALGVEHTTVARRIAALEGALGTPLFHRTAAGWRLTRAGEQIVARAEAIEQEVRGVVATSHAAAKVAAGRVRIACPESWAWAWLGPRLPLLHARHPALQVDLLTGPATMNLTRGEADVAFRVPRPTQPDLSCAPAGEGTIGLFARKDLADRHRRALDADPPRGRGVPLAIYTPEMSFLQSAPWFAALIAEADVRMRASSTMSLIAAAGAGLGVVPLPRFIAAHDPALVPAGGPDLARHKLWVVAHKDVRRDPRVAAVFAWARELADHVEASERLR
jgi:DNA-binding transcriptional LysR family regulator